MKFFGIRYFNIVDQQSELFKGNNPEKLFLSPFLNNDEVGFRNKIYTTRVFFREDDDRFLAGCFFKSKDTHVIALKENDFDETDILNWEKLYFIIDTEDQIFACQLKQSVANPSTIRNRILDLAQRYYRNSGYSLKLEFLRERESFWNLIKGSEEIYEINFSLNAPNLFGLSKEATGFLREVKDIYNIDSLDIGLKNENGTLLYDESELEPLRDYADDGGGKWTVKILEDGKKQTHSSDSYFSAKEIDLEENEQVSLIENVSMARAKLKQALILLKDARNS